MDSIRKQKSGHWRGQVRREGRSVSESFVRHDDARSWALEAKRQIDRGETPMASRITRIQTFAELIDLHIEDLKAVGRAPGPESSRRTSYPGLEASALNAPSGDRTGLGDKSAIDGWRR